MTNEIDQLIWNVLDGKASEGEIRELKSWMEEGESHREYSPMEENMEHDKWPDFVNYSQTAREGTFPEIYS